MIRLSFGALIGVSLLAFSAPVFATGKHPAPPAGAQRTAPWNAETSDLKPDQSVIYGKLPNGLIYAIRPNKRPQNQVLVRMALDFGSAAEADDEQGLAHFIEHMAFNGTTNVPEGEMVKMLERLGLAFGADTNASTGFTQTTYKLNLPRPDLQLIDKAFFLMRETASEITFDAGAVDRERGVVIAEMRQRENYSYQARRARSSFLYPGSYFSNRYPIGKKSVLENAEAVKMKALYAKWYRPDRTRIVVVGPVDPAAIEKMIVEKFSSWKNDGPPLADFDTCGFNTNRSSAASQFTHPKLVERIGIVQILPDKIRPDNFSRALLESKIRIAGAIIRERINRKRRKEDIPLLGAGLGFSLGLCDNLATVGLNMTVKDGASEQMLPVIEQTIRQAAQYGFTAKEISEQVKRLDANYINAANGAATRPSRAFAGALVGLGDNVLNDPADLQLLWLSIKPLLTSEAINSEFANWYDKLDRPLLFFQAKKAGDPDKLLSIFNESRKLAVKPPVKRHAKEFAYTDFGKAGEIAKDSRIDDLGIRTVRFKNNVLLNIKKTAFEDDRIRFSIRIAGGELSFGKDKAALTSLMNGTYISGGLEAHDYDELRSVLAGKTVRASLSASDEFFRGSGTIASADLETQLQLLAAYTAYPGYREEALRLYRRPLEERYARFDSTPGTALNIAYNRILTDNDPRFSLPPLETVKAHNLDQLKAILGNSLSKNRLEIGLVGDLDEEEAIAFVAKTFGALPQRSATADDYDAARQTKWSASTGIHEIPHKGEANQLSWRRAWPTTDGKDHKLDMTMDLLARVVRIRLLDELREKLGASYGGSASAYMSDIYPGRGTFSVSTSGDPKDLAAIEDTVEAIIAEMVTAPADDDLFERARKPVLESYLDWRKNNRTWIGLAALAQTRPDRLDRFRSSEAVFKSISAADIHQAAIRFLKNKDSYIFRSLPETLVKADAAQKNGAK